jgi:excisionase family DNA binding protein
MTKRKKPRIDAAPPIGEKLLTLREAAEVLRLSTRTVREYILRGEIEAPYEAPRREYPLPHARTRVKPQR